MFTKSLCRLTGSSSLHYPSNFAVACRFDYSWICDSETSGEVKHTAATEEKSLRILSLVSQKSSWKLWHNPKLSKPELPRNVTMSWEEMLQNKERHNCMSHGLWERKPFLCKGFETENYPVKLQVNTKQNILSSFLLTKIFILHHSLSSQTNLRKMFPSLTFDTMQSNSATLNMEYFKLLVLFLLFWTETIFWIQHELKKKVHINSELHFPEI